MPTSEEKIIQAVARHSLRNLLFMLGAAFTVGAWVTSMQYDMNAFKKQWEAQERKDASVSEWRATTTATISRHDWWIDNHEKRINGLERK